MATCNFSTLEASGAAYDALSERELLILQAGLLFSIAGVSVTPATYLANGVAYQALSDKELSILEAQLLCEILNS